MTYRKLILATGTCTGLLIAAASLAMPINAPNAGLRKRHHPGRR